MKTTSADLLEFGGIKSLLGRYISSPLGRAALDEAGPGVDRSTLEQALAETGEAIEYLRAASRPQTPARGAAVRLRFDSVPDPSEALGVLRMEGAVLEVKQILDLTELLDTATDLRQLLSSVSGRFPRLAARAAAIGEFRSVVAELAGKILPEGILADHASAELARLRRDMERQKRLTQESLERFLRRHREEDLLQEEFVTIRNERFVVPVIAGRQRRIEGVIHGSSASGHTLFVEPLETIELNNELVSLAEEEMREVHRILREMTARLREYRESIHSTAAALADLEFLFAKADFAADFDCVIPRFSAAGSRRFLLRAARHPLLQDVLRRQKKRVVPVSMVLDDECRTLLISGPNTGGKTVAMKTAGLLALMAQSGFPVPAEEAEMPLFGKVLADIGDNQSIQESLSTFSAHIARIREMLEEADSDSLVLLDELGRATDPEEGGALGVAVLERFRAAGAFTLASTHLVALKIYGAGTPGVVNGSMGFDEATLEPTYVLQLGAPGKSAGLEIARHLGMPGEIIEQARRRLSDHERDISRFLSELHRRLEQVASLEEQLQRQKESLASTEQAVAREWAARESAKLKELERRCALVLEKFENQARETIESIVTGAERKKTAAAALRQVGKVKRELRDEVETTVLATADESRQGQLAQPRIVEGARVKLKGVREPARVRRRLAGDLVEVEAGFLRLQVPADEILEVLPSTPETARPKNLSFDRAPLAGGAVRELNVIGQHIEEAREQVEKFLDNATLADLSRVRIVHGHGMGVLRRAIGELLAKHPDVEKFYPAEQNEGGTGATIVELKG
ncbi:MAG TPA: Smr/MutS family protein [Bryobacteraceae bacterium]|nr:Smr/MutS family protein [Bryobacteraceae bacterium]